MTDLPISQSQSINITGKFAAAFAGLIALGRSAISALTQATARNAQRRAMRRAP